MAITSFSDTYAFLSNFYPSPLVLDGVAYPTVEHAYQAAKALSPEDAAWVAAAPTPGEAKHRGRAVTVRPDWDDVRLEVMERALRAKFVPGTTLARALLATRGHHLTEGNTWGDRFWGATWDGRGWVGENHLGRLLMLVRTDLLVVGAGATREALTDVS